MLPQKHHEVHWEYQEHQNPNMEFYLQANEDDS